MASTSANGIITRAMVKARVISPGESIPSGKQEQLLDELNDMIESWSLEDLMIIADTEDVFTLTSGDGDYTWGSGGDFNSARPLLIHDESFVRVGDVDNRVRLKPMGDFRRISVKGIGGIPRIMAYNPEYSLVKVYLWPKPDSAYLFHVKSSKVMEQFDSATDTIDLAPGYRKVLVAGLAVIVCTNFGKKVPESLVYELNEAKSNIKTSNRKPPKIARTEQLSAMVRTRRGRSILSGPWD